MKHKGNYTVDIVSKYKDNKPLRPGADNYKKVPSLNSKECNTSKLARLKYSGDNLVGIATMHKSNAVPVTKDSDMAVQISRMRRN